MVAEASERLLHIKESIGNIRQLLDGKKIEQVQSERVLWSVYKNDLDPLEHAIDAMLAAHPPTEGFP